MTKKNKIGFTEIPESLHDSIFRTNAWTHYTLLREIKDYYLTNAWFKDEQIDALKYELKQMKNFIDKNNKEKLYILLSKLSDKEIKYIWVVGD
ncbi:hypothetical protein CEN49_24270 [Fischerella thermalis CCMEE 5273]|nr:hypothetical protein CEN49_24270 [Fischerella thermalis CCMEE 5273]